MTKLLTSALCLATFIFASAAQAATMNYTYSWTATNITDSNGGTPVNGANTTSGSFTIAFDTSVLPLQSGTPSAATTFMTNSSSATSSLSLSDGDIGYEVIVQDANRFRITLGAFPSGVTGLVGLSDDFRLQFFVDRGTGVTPNPTMAAFADGYTYNNSLSSATPTGGAFDGDLSISLTAVSPIGVVPLPAGLPLLLTALGAGALLARRRGAQSGIAH